LKLESGGQPVASNNLMQPLLWAVCVCVCVYMRVYVYVYVYVYV